MNNFISPNKNYENNNKNKDNIETNNLKEKELQKLIDKKEIVVNYTNQITKELKI